MALAVGAEDVQGDVSGQDVRPHCELDGSGRVADLQGAQDVLSMSIDRVDRNTECVGNLFAAFPLGEEAEHVCFARGEQLPVNLFVGLVEDGLARLVVHDSAECGPLKFDKGGIETKRQPDAPVWIAV